MDNNLIPKNTDHHFWIGSSHTVNQDYCLSGFFNGFYYAIVCDGCSSSPDTDFGARILAKTAINNIEIFNTPDFKTAVISSARAQAQSLGLPKQSLDATLAMAVYNGKDLIFKCFGDGSLISIFDNYYEITSYEFPSGAPFYLNYLLDQNRLDGYFEEFSFNPLINRYSSPDFIHHHFGIENIDLIKQNHCFYCEYFKQPKAIIVCSDGLESFYKRKTSETSKKLIPVAKKDLFENLLCFKSFNGEFLKRRSVKFLEFCKKEGWENRDDFSWAGVSFL